MAALKDCITTVVLLCQGIAIIQGIGLYGDVDNGGLYELFKYSGVNLAEDTLFKHQMLKYFYDSQSPHVSLPVMREMASRYLQKHVVDRTDTSGQYDKRELLTGLALFRLMSEEVAKTVLEGIDKEKDDKTYTFQIDTQGVATPLMYMDENGTPKGFALDVLEEVCKEAGKKCITIHQPYSKCINSIGTDTMIAGEGLQGRNFDACLIFSSTKHLENVVGFSDSYFKFTGDSLFFVRDGDEDFNPNNITGKRIGFVKAWHSSLGCLIENKVNGASTFLGNQVVLFDSPLHFKAAIDENKIDAGFSLAYKLPDANGEYAYDVVREDDGVHPVGNVIQCANGVKVTTRKDRQDVLQWFNTAFRKMKETGKYAALCQAGKIKHGKYGLFACEDY